MRLLKYEGYTLTIEPEALTIKSIKNLWNRDKSKNKERALSELGYIYFMVDPRSTYSYITDMDSREEKIILEEGLPKGWKPDKVVQDAMKSYKDSIITTSYLLLEDTKFAVDNLRKYLRSMDFTETDDKGKPKYPINMIINAIKQIPDLTKQLRLAEIAIQQEIDENSKIRGQRSKALLEDGFENFNS